MTPSKYRSANLIIQTILEGILRANLSSNLVREGIIKSHLIRYSGLKTTVAEKYLAQMEKAGYIESHEEAWGERKIIIYTITSLGKERLEWFTKICSELE